MKTNKLEDRMGEILIPRDKAADQLVKRLEAKKSLPLISIHGPSGVGKSDLAGPILTKRLKTLSGKSTPKLLQIDITGEDAAIDVALKVTDLIIENHSEFRSRKSANVFRDKMTRSVRRCPAEAAERLRSMMLSSEKGKFDFKKVQLVICLDGIDKLFESRARCGSDISKAAICGDVNDPVGFLSKLVGMKTIVFSLVYRSWVSRDVRAILDKGGIDEERRCDLSLSYPNAEEVESIVASVLEPIKQQAETPTEIEEYGDLLADTLRKNPPLIGLLPATLDKMFGDAQGGHTNTEGCVDRHLENNGIVGDLAKMADGIYLSQNSNNRLALEEVFFNLIKGEGRLLIKDVTMSEELWAIALKFVENRILAIDGRSYRDARFITTHQGLLSIWKRAVSWTGEKRSVGITQLRSLDDRALSWQLAERNKTLLIASEEDMECANLILRDSELSSKLSPLTREFLARSIKPKPDMKRLLLSKKVWVPSGAFFAILFLLAVVIVVIPDPGAAPQIAQTTEEQPEEKPIRIVTRQAVPKSFLEEIEIPPGPEELLASAERISGTTDEVIEDVLLLEDDWISETPEFNVPPAAPQLTEQEVFAHINEMKVEGSQIPLGLPSAHAHLEKGLSKIKEQPLIAKIARPVPQDGLESAAGHLEKRTLPKLRSNDSGNRIYQGLSNHRLKSSSSKAKKFAKNMDSPWLKILNTMGSGIAAKDLSVVLDGLRAFHERTVDHPNDIKNIKNSEFQVLTSTLGKIASAQQDKVAMQGAWELETASRNGLELDTDLRMLMARIALNAGRDKEAVAYLAQTEIQNGINQASVDFMKAALGWHFKESGKATESFRKLLHPQASVN